MPNWIRYNEQDKDHPGHSQSTNNPSFNHIFQLLKVFGEVVICVIDSRGLTKIAATEIFIEKIIKHQIQ